MSAAAHWLLPVWRDIILLHGMRGYVAFALAAFLTECMGEDGPPSNLFVVGGFPKCSSSHIFRLLQSHPNTVTFGKQVGSLPGAEIEFEKATFAIARTLQMPGKPIISACTGLPLRPLKECTRLASYVRGSYDNSTAAVLVITDIFFLEKKVLTSSFKPIQPRNLTTSSPKPRAALY